MSVICQNFVQNAWKKDLCSNCFKSKSDHLSKSLSNSCAVENAKNGANHHLNTRYVSQATTIYHSRGFLSHAAWKSLMSERGENNNKFFKIDEGFHNTLFSISTSDLDKNCRNNNMFASIMKKACAEGINSKIKLNVGFKEEEPLVIGYGGNDYDSEEAEWEMGSDDGDFTLGSLDVTAEDRAFTKITKENTEFNSKNDNLLNGFRTSENSVNNNVLPNESPEQQPSKPPLKCGEGVKNIGNDVKGKVEPNENSHRKIFSGISSSAILRKESPPQASVKPFIREEPEKVKRRSLNIGNPKPECEFSVNKVSSSESESCNDTTVDKVEVIHESVIVLVDSNDISMECKTENGNICDYTEPRDENECSAIYTPANNDLFVSKASSSSDESDSGAFQPHKGSIVSLTPTSPQENILDGNHNCVEKTEVDIKKPPKPVRSTIIRKSDSNSVLENEHESINKSNVTVNYNTTEFDQKSPKQIHYAVSNTLGQSAESENVYQEVEKQNVDRVSKLAALAHELEQARYAASGKRQAPAPPILAEQSPTSSPSSGPPSISSEESINHFKEPTNSTKIYGFPFELKTKSATMSSVQGRKVLAILNFDDSGSNGNNNVKNKKGKFSIKKFLKRGKDMESLDQIFQTQTPNPKAWKQAEFDRSKLKLEILHPMDLATQRELSRHSSTEESSPESSSLTDSDNNNDVVNAEEMAQTNGIYDDELTWKCSPTSPDQGMEEINSLETPVENVHVTFGTPSPLHMGTPQNISNQFKSNSKGVRPPKPPPPPRLRSVIPGRNVTTTKSTDSLQMNGGVYSANQKPQVPKRLYKQNTLSEYANLGDVRSKITPRKPERFVVSQSSQEEENEYEPVGAYDQQLYQDTSEIFEDNVYCEPPSDSYHPHPTNPSSYISVAQKENDVYTKSPTHEIWKENQITKNDDENPSSTQRLSTAEERQSRDSPQKYLPSCGNEKLSTLAWQSLEHSYAIVATANHEVLAKLLDQVVNEKSSVIQRSDGKSIRWSDFYFQPNQPIKSIGGKLIYNAVLRHYPQRQVTLVVSLHFAACTTKESPPTKHLLGYFSDEIPKTCVPAEWLNTTSEGVPALVYILPRSEINSIQSLFLGSRMDKSDLTLNEKDLCFVALQLIQALKILQAHGTEEIDLNVDKLIIAQDEKDHLSNLIVIESDICTANKSKITLCQCAVSFLQTFSNNSDSADRKANCVISNLTRKVFDAVTKVLVQEKASSLSRARQLLECYLWGPNVDSNHIEATSDESEETLQRWLDIERAHSLRLLVRFHKGISSFEEHQLQFLVRTNATNLKDLFKTLRQ